MSEIQHTDESIEALLKKVEDASNELWKTARSIVDSTT